MSNTDGSLSEEIGYADAMAELDSILRSLESSDVDVDLLAEKVARSSQLISLCRGRILTAQMSVEKIVTSLDADS